MQYTHQQKILLDLLYLSLDDMLAETESKKLAKALEEQSWLQEELVHIKSIRLALGEIQIPKNKKFVADVMANLPAKKEFVFQSLWRLSVAAAIIAIVLAAGLIYYSSGSFNTDAILGIEQIEMEHIYVLNY